MRQASEGPAQASLEDGLWLTIAELARRRNVTRQTMAERVDRLAAGGHLIIRREGRSKLVNLAQFDRAVGETGDPAKEVAAETKAADAAPAAVAANPGYRDAQTRAKQYEADLKFLELEERLGRLVPIADLADVVNEVGEEIVRVIERLPSHADDMAAAVGKEGVIGARAQYKRDAREVRERIAEAMGKLAARFALPAAAS